MSNIATSKVTVTNRGDPRVDWVDYARGFCIILVVMMHSTLGVGEAMGGEGWLHAVVEWARPFRIPAFFMIAGLFLHRTIGEDWRNFLDRKVLHFLYFYLLWMIIQCLLKCWPAGVPGWPDGARDVGLDLLLHLMQPIGTLWFIYVLPIFYVMTRLLRGAPPLAVLAVAAVAHSLPLNTGWITLDEVAGRYVFFYAGYAFHQLAFHLADSVRKSPGKSLVAIAAWSLINAAAMHVGASNLPGVSLALGLAGASAVIAASSLLAGWRVADFISFVGRNSMVIYLAFFIPMVAARLILLRAGLIADIGLVSLIVTMVAVAAPVPLAQWADRFGGRFLFTRPNGVRLSPA